MYLHPTDICYPEIGAVQYEALRQLAAAAGTNRTEIDFRGREVTLVNWSAPLPVLSRDTKVASERCSGAGVRRLPGCLATASNCPAPRPGWSLLIQPVPLHPEAAYLLHILLTHSNLGSLAGSVQLGRFWWRRTMQPSTAGCRTMIQHWHQHRRLASLAAPGPTAATVGTASVAAAAAAEPAAAAAVQDPAAWTAKAVAAAAAEQKEGEEARPAGCGQ